MKYGVYEIMAGANYGDGSSNTEEMVLANRGGTFDTEQGAKGFLITNKAYFFSEYISKPVTILPLYELNDL